MPTQVSLRSARPPHSRRARSRRLRFASPPALLVVLATVLALAGCSSRQRLNAVDNMAPEVSLDPTAPPSKNPDGTLHLVGWSGRDPDGRVDHYRVAINPVKLDDADPAWTSTADRRVSLLAKRRVGLGAAGRDRTVASMERTDGRDFDLIAVEAVDDQGAVSTPAYRVFFEDNVAPTVTITSPVPSALVAANVPPDVTIRFKGIDPDAADGRPACYKYLLLGPNSEFPLNVALVNPDSLRRFYAPDFATWDVVPESPAGGGEVALHNLVIGETYVLAVIAVDAEGAYSPIFSLNTNMLRMRVFPVEALGPLISLVTGGSIFPGITGGLPGRTIPIEVPAGQRVGLSWFATPAAGLSGIEYRWCLDPQDLDKELKRPRAGNDLQHWRPWSPDLKNATIGPFAGGETHLLVIEARDELGSRSRLSVRIAAVAATFEKELLIVDDTRLFPDQLQGACVKPPAGAWPTAAELDTFLYARGGVPWRCYPAGTMSPPGLFAGYAFDTLGTRTGAEPIVPLDVLNRYRNIVWIVDAASARMNRSPSDPTSPITALRYMSQPGQQNTLATYVLGGGRLWLLGGGAAQATLLPWNRTSNDGGGVTWSNVLGELVPGTFMYDIVHWRSEIKAVTAQMFIQRYTGRNPAWPGVPDYNRLPIQLRNKSTALDPFPPGRSGQSPSVFYRSTYDAEFVSAQNFMLENGESVLDSLYRMTTFTLPPTATQRICATYYHGRENAPVMFSGFDIWSFTRPDEQAVVDFVMQDVWGMTKNAAAEPLVNATPQLR